MAAQVCPNCNTEFGSNSWNGDPDLYPTCADQRRIADLENTLDGQLRANDAQAARIEELKAINNAYAQAVDSLKDHIAEIKKANTDNLGGPLVTSTEAWTFGMQRAVFEIEARLAHTALEEAHGDD